MSEIKVDDLTGKTSAGDITVTSEGGAATMQLQQGLAKHWVNINGFGTVSTRKSFNESSVVDVATGTFTSNFSNNMSDINFCVSGLAGHSDGTLTSLSSPQRTPTLTSTTSKVSYQVTYQNASRYDAQYVFGVTHGDLA